MTPQTAARTNREGCSTGGRHWRSLRQRGADRRGRNLARPAPEDLDHRHPEDQHEGASVSPRPMLRHGGGGAARGFHSHRASLRTGGQPAGSCRAPSAPLGEKRAKCSADTGARAEKPSRPRTGRPRPRPRRGGRPPGAEHEARVQHHRATRYRPADPAEAGARRDGTSGVAEEWRRVLRPPAVTVSIGTPAVVVAAEERERPEVRRRPHEDQREHREALVGDAPRRHRPADHRREGPRGAADDDVLRRRPLEPHRVDDGVEEDREREQPAAKRFEERQQHHREPGEASRAPSPRAVDAPGRDRPLPVRASARRCRRPTTC